MSVAESDLELPDGRTLHVYDSGGADTLTIYWHPGSPQTGMPPAPPLTEVGGRPIRWLAHDRPGYGGSSPVPGRSVSDVAADVVAQLFGQPVPAPVTLPDPDD